MTRASTPARSRARRALGRSRKRRRATRAGYTLIEVMMAVAIMTVGSMGLLRLQEATTHGNRTAREVATATDITRIYLERTRRDALRWNAAGASAVASTDMLSEVGNGWFIPSATTTLDTDSDGSPDPELASYAYTGEATSTAAEMFFCVNMQATWVVGTDAMRVETRVWWHRPIAGTARMNATCATDPATITTELANAVPRLRTVSGSTIVRWMRTAS